MFQVFHHEACPELKGRIFHLLNLTPIPVEEDDVWLQVFLGPLNCWKVAAGNVAEGAGQNDAAITILPSAGTKPTMTQQKRKHLKHQEGLRANKREGLILNS